MANFNFKIKLYTKQNRLTNSLLKAYSFSIVLGRKTILKKAKFPKNYKRAKDREVLVSRLLFRIEFYLSEKERIEEKNRKKREELKLKLDYEANLHNEKVLVSSAKLTPIKYGETIVMPLRAEISSKNEMIYDSHIDHRLYTRSKQSDGSIKKSEVLIYNVYFFEPILLFRDDATRLRKVRRLMSLHLKDFYLNKVNKNVKGISLFCSMHTLSDGGQESGIGFGRQLVRLSSKEKVYNSLVKRFKNAFQEDVGSHEEIHRYFLNRAEHDVKTLKKKKDRSAILGFQFVLYLGFRPDSFSHEKITKERFKSVLSKTVIK